MHCHGLRYSLAALLLATTVQAQAPEVPRTTHFWVTAASGYAHVTERRDLLGDPTVGWMVAGTVQHGALVGTFRSAHYTDPTSRSWDVAALVGAGTPAKYGFRGSIGGGLGVAQTRDGSTVVFPAELQLGWRFTSNIGLGSYFFMNLGDAMFSYGGMLGIQVGRLR